MAKRKPTRGGRRPGAGRKVSTGSDATKPIRYRLSAAERYLIESATPDGDANQFSKRETLAAARRATGGTTPKPE